MIQKLTKEQLVERERVTREIVDELLNEEAVQELETLDLRERQPFHVEGYWESDRDFLAYGHNYRAAALLLSIYIRQRRTPS